MKSNSYKIEYSSNLCLITGGANGFTEQVCL